jgi:hypothetical protein
MGIDISGGMMVGAHYEDINDNLTSDEAREHIEEEGFWDWAAMKGMDSASPYYDSCSSERYWGFWVDDVDLSDDNAVRKWWEEVERKQKEFEDITNTRAMLIGAQDVY